MVLHIDRVAFQGEPGAFSEAAAVQLLGDSVTTVPRSTFDAAFAAIKDGSAEALLVPVENTLAGSVVRVFDLLLDSELKIVGETILPIEHHLIGCPGSTLADIRAVASHPMALAQCERLFNDHPSWKRVPAEDTAGSVREILARQDKSFAAIAANAPPIITAASFSPHPCRTTPKISPASFFSFPPPKPLNSHAPDAHKMSIAMRLAHRPGALLASLEPFARHQVNLLKIESRPIHGRPWEYQFFLDWNPIAPALSKRLSPRSAAPPPKSASSASIPPPKPFDYLRTPIADVKPRNITYI